MQMLIYRRKFKAGDIPYIAFKWTETTIKSLVILSVVTVITGAMVWLWYGTFYLHHIHIPHDDREIVATGVIPGLFILYSLLTAVLLQQVFLEYKNIRMAVKRNDIRLFMELKDEDLSPLLHVMVTVVASVILGAFMLLEYSSFWWGALVVGTMTMVFGLLCVVVYELDDPCYGFWVIKSIPRDWLETDAKTWRRNNPIGSVTVTKTVEEKVEVKVAPPPLAAEKPKEAA